MYPHFEHLYLPSLDLNPVEDLCCGPTTPTVPESFKICLSSHPHFGYFLLSLQKSWIFDVYERFVTAKFVEFCMPQNHRF